MAQAQEKQHHQEDGGLSDIQRDEKGFMVSPWIVTLAISLAVNFVGFAYTWGTVVTRLDSLITRVERLERLSDSERERTRGGSVNP